MIERLDAVRLEQIKNGAGPSTQECAAMVAEIQSARASPAPPTTEGRAGWRPIGIAPRDGTRVLGFFPDLQDGYHDTNWTRHGVWASRAYPNQPTYWQPLPSPPDGDGKQEQATRAEDGPTAPISTGNKGHD